MKTIEEARAEAAQYAAAGFVMTGHHSVLLADEPFAFSFASPYFNSERGVWMVSMTEFQTLADALAACESINDGSVGRRIAEASRRARGIAKLDRRPDVGFGAKHIAARAVVDSLPAGRPPVEPLEHAALREAYERVRAVAAAAAGMMSSRVNPRERGRMIAALEDALGRIHDGDLAPWGSPTHREQVHDVKATLDAAPPEDLLDATRSAR